MPATVLDKTLWRRLAAQGGTHRLHNRVRNARSRPTTQDVDITDADARTLRAALEYGQARLREAEPNGYPAWMDEPDRRVLRANPYRLFVAFSLNGQTRADDAWRAPQRLADRGVVLDPHWIVAHRDQVVRAVLERPVIHRYKTQAAEWIVRGAERLLRVYRGDPTAIWSGEPRARDVYTRLLRFHGIGPEKAAFATGFLVESLRVSMRDLHDVPVKVDVHVRRVSMRTGIAPGGGASEIRRVTQAFSPEFPFRIDRGLWFVGHEHCHERSPACSACPLSQSCRKLIGVTDERLPASPAPHRRGRPGQVRRSKTSSRRVGRAVMTSSQGSRTQRDVYDPRARRARIDAGLDGGHPSVAHAYTVGAEVRLVDGLYAGTHFTVVRLEPWNPIGPITLWRAEPYAPNRKYPQVFPQEIRGA